MVYDGRTLDFTFKAYPKLNKAIKAEWKSIFGSRTSVGEQENEDDEDDDDGDEGASGKGRQGDKGRQAEAERPFCHAARFATSNNGFEADSFESAASPSLSGSWKSASPLALPELTVSSTVVQHVKAASRGQPRLGPAPTKRKDFPLDKNLIWREMQQQVRQALPLLPSAPPPPPPPPFAALALALAALALAALALTLAALALAALPSPSLPLPLPRITWTGLEHPRGL